MFNMPVTVTSVIARATHCQNRVVNTDLIFVEVCLLKQIKSNQIKSISVEWPIKHQCTYIPADKTAFESYKQLRREIEIKSTKIGSISFTGGLQISNTRGLPVTLLQNVSNRPYIGDKICIACL